MPGTVGKITVIPNYVDTDLFRPETADKDIDLLFIGRLTPQKNLFALLEALQGLGLKTVIIGKGAQEKELRERAVDLGVRIEWKENIPNSDLPRYLNRSRMFILPSHYEGHPKALIEAMAAGLPVIGADAPGIRELIVHMKNGWLCRTDTGSIREAITEISASADIRTHLSKNARAFALSHYTGSIREAITEISASADIRTHLSKNARAFALSHYSLTKSSSRNSVCLKASFNQLERHRMVIKHKAPILVAWLPG